MLMDNVQHLVTLTQGGLRLFMQLCKIGMDVQRKTGRSEKRLKINIGTGRGLVPFPDFVHFQK